MSGITTLLNIAKGALAAQQYGLNVTGHNIANVNTPGYSRQNVPHTSAMPYQAGGFLIGNGVEVDQIQRSTDLMLENRLRQSNSDLAGFEEIANYIRILENAFNENTDDSMNQLLSDFWNSWQDLSNNPQGIPERVAVYNAGVRLTEKFDALNAELLNVETEMTQEVEVSITEINNLTVQIADLNKQIVVLETTRSANDLHDKRDVLVTQLAQHIGIRVFPQDNGAYTIVTGNGNTLISGVDAYRLELSGGRVYWEGSAGMMDITDRIEGGKVGGWLDMRDEIVAKYKTDLDELAHGLAWSVNLQHSQGAGLEYFDAQLIGSYAVTNPAADLSFTSTLDFGDKIDFTKNFKMWIKDNTPAAPVSVEIDLSTLATPSLNEFVAAFNVAAGGRVLASVNADNQLQFQPQGTNQFAFGDDGFDDSGFAAALGINTFFQGHDAMTIRVNEVLLDPEYIAAAKLDINGAFGVGDNRNALALTDAQHMPVSIDQWTYIRNQPPTSKTVSTSFDEYYRTMVSSLGVKALSTSRDVEFNQTMVTKIGEQRDSISAVSLDEEMVSLMKYQHAYAVAAKLLTMADEVLEDLVRAK